MAVSANGQASRLSTWKRGFNSPYRYHAVVNWAKLKILTLRSLHMRLYTDYVKLNILVIGFDSQRRNSGGESVFKMLS